MADPKIRLSPEWQEYERRVQSLEDEGLTRSDAQGVVDAEDIAYLAAGLVENAPKGWAQGSKDDRKAESNT